MTNQEIIEKIKFIINEWGDVSTKELELETSPVYSYVNRSDYHLIEYFNKGQIGVTHYINDEACTESEYSYEELDRCTLEEILFIVEDYNIDMINKIVYENGSN